MRVPEVQPGRDCYQCGAKLSRYNPDPLCWGCQEKRRGNILPAPFSSHPPLPTSRSTFALRSILDTVRRAKPNYTSDVGQTLKRFRVLHHLTQRDLADILGFDQSYISKLENGQNVRDIVTLKHILHCLCLPAEWLGLAEQGSSSGQSTDLIEIAPSVIKLSQTAREAGRADAAVAEVWPLILRLEAQIISESSHTQLLMTLAAALAVLGVILGDLLPEEDLWVSVHFFKKAVRIVDDQADREMAAEIYRGYGNELRKHKQYAEAVPYLEQALRFSPDPVSKGYAAALLARTFGEMGDRENFHDAIHTALHFQDITAAFTPTFNPVMIQEVYVRGLTHVGSLAQIPTLINQDVSRSLSVSVAPQWHVISHLTKAEAQFRLNRVDEGLENLKTALTGAELCKLPHQVQRAIRAVHPIESYSPAKAIGDDARVLLRNLSLPTRPLLHLQ
ncbi:hypothetical protein KSF_106540 [Reticulibacter mediterranei]|uniref:HTH cro/C1-type domain-containing protein n=1 Tax=Reticulibacter mediterranei TaxID=2778369 RepID=A0A8J3J300_9CHLR|nr:helix-turn-helix domain-containing protein [Reticulibacter mediterranei]GHP00607.1 hypothetical protein KSF_106540 [Reticulibacter mediterranei]